MPWNDKSLRLRACRDRLHQTGQYAPTFQQSIELIIEILGLVHSPRNLWWCRRYTARLRDHTPNPTEEQIRLFGILDDRLFKKGELIKARQERKKGTKAGRTKCRTQLRQAGPIPQVPADQISRNPEEVNGRGANTRENPRPSDPDFHSVLEEFER
jgi:hypothetical protein